MRLRRHPSCAPARQPWGPCPGLAVTYGPLPVLTEALLDAAGVEQAFVYGSWAARYLGETGPVPGDVDLLVIGDADPDDLDDRARVAEARLRREVNIRRVRRSAWDAGDDAFIATVRARPMVELRTNVTVSPGKETA